MSESNILAGTLVAFGLVLVLFAANAWLIMIVWGVVASLFDVSTVSYLQACGVTLLIWLVRFFFA